MVQRNLGKIQETLETLTEVERNLNELIYYQKYLKSPNHSYARCAAVRSSINSLHEQHAQVVSALIAYGTHYQSTDEALAFSNNPDYNPPGSCYHFTYVSAPEHEKSFWEKTWNQIILGDYSQDTTWLGTTVSLAASFLGVDAPMDVRDLTANVGKGEWGWALLNAVSLLPVIGVLGTGGKTAAKGSKALGGADNVADLLKKGRRADALTRAAGKADIPVWSAKSGRNYLLNQDSFRIVNKAGKTEVTVYGVRYVPNFQYVKKSSTELDILRSEFNTTIRKKFISEKLAVHHVDELKRLDFTDAQIERMRLSGELPDGYHIHHKFSLDDGGTNDFSNLILIRSDQHQAFTAFQNGFTHTKDFLGQGRITVNWVVPTGAVHIPGPPSRIRRKFWL